MITQKSWWDTVDFIAATMVGNYFKKYPEMIKPVTDKWMVSQNMWLQRSCLLFQLKYKAEVNTDLLASFILSLSVSREFFITKAIGWSLRQYSKFDPQWVINFVSKNSLQPLSKREALRLII
jgi:3-methyladenine DNA glycosylase AlkD